MPTAPPAGPRFTDLARDESGGTGAPASPSATDQPPGGPVFTNDPAQHAIMTNPIHAARIRTAQSRAVLERLAHELASQRRQAPGA